MHDYVIYCYRLPAGSGSMFAMGISVPQFIGSIGLLNYDDEASLRQSLGVMGLSAAQQNQLIAGVAATGAMFVMSGVSIDNNVAANFGIHLHDGEMPNESKRDSVHKVRRWSGFDGEYSSQRSNHARSRSRLFPLAQSAAVPDRLRRFHRGTGRRNETEDRNHRLRHGELEGRQHRNPQLPWLATGCSRACPERSRRMSLLRLGITQKRIAHRVNRDFFPGYKSQECA